LGVGFMPYSLSWYRVKFSAWCEWAQSFVPYSYAGLCGGIRRIRVGRAVLTSIRAFWGIPVFLEMGCFRYFGLSGILESGPNSKPSM
jgi:hypothetical protein